MGKKQGRGHTTTNGLPRSNASSKLGRGRVRNHHENVGGRRSADTIKRLKMYGTGKPIRDKDGRVIGGNFMMDNRAGDREIDGSSGRIAPDRRWFGNTRLIAPKQLDNFRREMTTAISDPYSVVLKRKKVPMGLLADETAAGDEVSMKGSALLEQESFEDVFGKKSKRKRVKLEQYMVPRNKSDNNNQDNDDDKKKQADNNSNPYSMLLSTAQQSQAAYEEINTREGMVPWGRDSMNLENQQGGEGVDWRHEKKDDLFLKGQSKRIWNEFYKVIDCSDVILHIIDARNVPGTRCTMIEKHITTNAKHKHLVFVLNKVDLVPNWVAKRWMGILAEHRPTVAFHASQTHAFGKGALLNLLRQFAKLHDDKKQISVGIVGYPNVGKSSVINTLTSQKSVKVAPIPGETKVWQYVTLFKRVALIDCPGVVVDTAGDTETDSVLKGVVRAERLQCPEEFVDAILAKVKPEHIAAQYKIDQDDNWSNNSTLLLERIAQKSGRLLKGGEPCLRSAAIMLIHDFQRGRLPHYVAPPELKEKEESSDKQQDYNDNVKPVKQDLDHIGQEQQEEDAMEDEEKKQTVASKGGGGEDGGGDDDDDTSSSSSSEEVEEEEQQDESEDRKQQPVKNKSHATSSELIGAGDWDDEDEE